jgi:hypothetical protein
MESIDENARLKYFADLRPSSTYVASDMHGAGHASVVALAIREFPSVSVGDEEPVLLYYVLELDGQGFVIDDWFFPEDLEGALGYLDEFPGVEWEELKLADGEAPVFVRNRLAESPQR